MKILAVDDDKSILELLPMLLESAGYDDVEVYDTPEDVLLKLQDSTVQYDCLFLDIQMPGMSGIELCRKIRDFDGYKETPIIMLTAMSDRPSIDQAFAAGATDFVTKPFDVTEIGARVRIAEKLHIAQNAANAQNTTQNTTMADQPAKTLEELEPLSLNNDDVVKLPFLEAQHFQNIDGAVEYKALTNYLGQLSKTGLYSSNVFAVKIDQAAELHGQTNPLEFSYALITFADALSATLKEKGFFLMTYAGSGHFVCVAHNDDSDGDVEMKMGKALQSAVEAKKMAFDNDEPMQITVTVGKSLRPAVSVYKRTDRIFRAAIARVEAKFDAKKQTVREEPVRQQA